jgi:hypothetical protein
MKGKSSLRFEGNLIYFFVAKVISKNLFASVNKLVFENTHQSSNHVLVRIGFRALIVGFKVSCLLMTNFSLVSSALSINEKEGNQEKITLIKQLVELTTQLSNVILLHKNSNNDNNNNVDHEFDNVCLQIEKIISDCQERNANLVTSTIYLPTRFVVENLFFNTLRKFGEVIQKLFFSSLTTLNQIALKKETSTKNWNEFKSVCAQLENLNQMVEKKQDGDQDDFLLSEMKAETILTVLQPSLDNVMMVFETLLEQAEKIEENRNDDDETNNALFLNSAFAQNIQVWIANDFSVSKKSNNGGGSLSLTSLIRSALNFEDFSEAKTLDSIIEIDTKNQKQQEENNDVYVKDKKDSIESKNEHEEEDEEEESTSKMDRRRLQIQNSMLKSSQEKCIVMATELENERKLHQEATRKLQQEEKNHADAIRALEQKLATAKSELRTATSALVAAHNQQQNKSNLNSTTTPVVSTTTPTTAVDEFSSNFENNYNNNLLLNDFLNEVRAKMNETRFFPSFYYSSSSSSERISLKSCVFANQLSEQQLKWKIFNDGLSKWKRQNSNILETAGKFVF